MQRVLRYYSPQTGGGNSQHNQKEEGKAGKSGSKQRSTVKTTEKGGQPKGDKKNANSVD